MASGFPGLRLTTLGVLLVAGWASVAQTLSTTFPANGTTDPDVVSVVLEHATVHLPGGEVLRDGAVWVKHGRVEAVGPTGGLPVRGAVVRVDLTGLHLYPSWVDLTPEWGWPSGGVAKTAEGRPGSGAQELSDKKGAYGWNEAIRPEVDAVDYFDPRDEGQSGSAAQLRKAGIGTVLVHVQDGIARGTGVLATVGNDPRRALLAPRASAHWSFQRGSSSQDYPRSLMGAIALIEQSHHDATWYAAAEAAGERPEPNLSLSALAASRRLPTFFAVAGWADALRADALRRRVGAERPWVMTGVADGYQRVEELKATGAACLVPLNFPKPFDVADPEAARLIAMGELQHWEWAPSNAAVLHAAGVPFAFTTAGLKDPADAWAATRKAIARGLSPEAALAAWTEVPARLVGAADRVGSIRVGAEANFLVMSGPIWEPDSRLLEHWVQGVPEVLADREEVDIRGWYDVGWENQLVRLEISGKRESPEAALILPGAADTLRIPVRMRRQGRQLQWDFRTDTLGMDGWVRLQGQIWMDSRILEGEGIKPDGSTFTWSGVRQSDERGDPRSAKSASGPAGDEPPLGELVFPFTAYGRPEIPRQGTVWIRNATVWTNESQGILPYAEVLIHQGKIAAVGNLLQPAQILGPDAIAGMQTIDASGKHVTSGIIDEHSHIAIARGVNEGTQASSAEVCIGHVLDSEDVEIYRQLAGGVTSAQLLHGSANPIGGQSAVIKLRWGASPAGLHFEGSVPFIKFALGENVKQSNWGNEYRSRFPQSRMGVEQVYYDHFLRAAAYDAAWQAYAAESVGLSRRDRRAGVTPVAPRRDLELEALAQILREERFITCHSYRQDEINMLMHVADSLGFRINTFTHILEGYKVADKMAAHGAGGSSFSDWWAYKYEVKDAIPYNGAVLHGQGVVTAFNSDDAEMARRLNQEAAKAVKYGGVSEEEAWKFVTLNPAKLLHIDHRVGSLAPGKDADVVIWSDHPLSIYARAEATFVDGRLYFDLASDAALRASMVRERARIIQRMASDDTPKEERRKPSERMRQHYHCDTLTDEIR